MREIETDRQTDRQTERQRVKMVHISGILMLAEIHLSGLKIINHKVKCDLQSDCDSKVGRYFPAPEHYLQIRK